MLLKEGYVLAIAAAAAATLWPLLRPDALPTGYWRWVGVPILVLGAMATIQLVSATPNDVHSLLFGSSWRKCPARVAALSAPVFIGLCWAIRRQAPVRLRAAGAAAGLLSGAAAAAIYALACTEQSTTFVLLWYSLGIAVSIALGAIIGPPALRW